MVHENLILRLRTPAKAYVGDQGNGDGLFVVDGILCRTGFPPWPSAADLLFRESTRELCGVSYQVAPEFRQGVREFAEALDRSCARYIGEPLESRPEAYRGESEDIHYLEITWSETRADAIALAQLGGDLWYYAVDREAQATQTERAFAYGIGDMSELLREHRLRFPHRLALPRTLTIREARGSHA
jgi:hypothetical protein